MIPTNSSGTTNGCDSISSNCVIWQGPDIACIDLCNGDTISEVTAKLAQKVCDLITNVVNANPDLTGLDLTCLNIKGVTPTELVPVLQEMVNAICANNTNSRKSSSGDLPDMDLPACLQYDDANGNPVTKLPLDQFATLIANQVCTNLNSINLINSTLTSFSSRLDVLEACVLPCSGTVPEVQIVPTCVSTVGVLTNVSVVVLALESEFCALRTAVGTPAVISQAINQSSLTGSTTSLSNSSVSYGSIAGWNTNATSLAESVQNAWVVIDDMYSAIADIQNNCCPSGCDSVVFASTHSVQYDMTTGLVNVVLFNFTGSTIPASFNDVAGFSKVTLTDVNGSSLTEQFSISSLQNSGGGLQVNTGSLVTTQDLSINVEYAVTNGSDTCETAIASTVSGYVPCPGNIQLSTITSTEATISFTQQLGTNAVYLLELYDATGTTLVTSYTINNPGPNPSHQFTGLTPNTSFILRITTTFQGGSIVCPDLTFATLEGSAPCSDGMDVAFVLDYTGSMASDIEAVKSGVATLVNTIDTSSGANDYRLGLVTADEYYASDPNYPSYASCADYTSLPAAQRIENLGTNNSRQIITAWEMFNTNNGAAFTTQLNKLNKGVDGTCINLGNGAGTPEPTDYASQLITTSDFVGAFRSSVARYIIIITDKLPGGTGDTFNATVWAGIQSMITYANLNGIKYFVCGAGTNLTGGSVTSLYPWRELAEQTGGDWNQSVDASVISAQIVAGCS